MHKNKTVMEQPKMKTFLLNRYMNLEKGDYTSKINWVYQFFGDRNIDLVIDAAEKTILEKVTLEDALKVTKTLAEIFVLDIHYNVKESAICLELLRYADRNTCGKQKTA